MREIALNGYIDEAVWFGDEITPDALHDMLYEAGADQTEDVHIRLNSYGGNCNAATQMHDELAAYPGKIFITVSGTAASAATVLAMAADRLEMTPGSLWMIHNPSVMAVGNEQDLMDAIGLLRACKDSIINVYGKRCHMGREIISDMMSKTTWMDAQTALGNGFIDSIAESAAGIWRCNSKFTGEEKCQTPHLTEEEIKARFLDAFNMLVADKERLLDECRTMQAVLTDTGSLDSEIAALLSEMEVVAELTKRCIEENSTTAQSQDTYLEKYNALVARYETAKAKLEKLQAAKAQREAKAEDIGGFMFELAEHGESLTEFDDRLWLTVIDIVTVHRDGRLAFKFQTGHEMLE